MKLIERLIDLHKQATVERSHYYVGSLAKEAAGRLDLQDELLGLYREYVVMAAEYSVNGGQNRPAIVEVIKKIALLETKLKEG